MTDTYTVFPRTDLKRKSEYFLESVILHHYALKVCTFLFLLYQNQNQTSVFSNVLYQNEKFQYYDNIRLTDYTYIRQRDNRASDWLAYTSRCDHPAVSMLDSTAAIGFPV